jgi:hypothetical protein
MKPKRLLWEQPTDLFHLDPGLESELIQSSLMMCFLNPFPLWAYTILYMSKTKF